MIVIKRFPRPSEGGGPSKGASGGTCEGTVHAKVQVPADSHQTTQKAPSSTP